MPQMPHPAVTPAEPTVLIEDQPAAIAGCATESEQLRISGEPTVLIAGHPAATLDGKRSGEPCGMPTVLIAGRPALETGNVTDKP